MKTKEELNVLKEEVKALNKKLAELSEDELKEVTGGTAPELPATKLGPSAYDGKLNGCPGLKPGSGLPATESEGMQVGEILQRGKNGNPTLVLHDA